MINYSFFRSNLGNALAFLLATLLLQGCGAERTTPFNHPEPECSSSSLSSRSSSSSSSDDLFSSSSSSSSSTNSSCSPSSKSSSLSSSSSSSSSSVSSVSSSDASSSVVSTTLEMSELWNGEETATPIVPNVKSTFEVTEAQFDEVVARYIDPSNLVEPESGYFNESKIFLIDGGEINSCEPHFEFNGSLNAIDVSDSSVKIKIGFNEVKGSSTCTPSISHPFWIFHIKTSKQLGFEDDIKQ